MVFLLIFYAILFRCFSFYYYLLQSHFLLSSFYFSSSFSFFFLHYHSLHSTLIHYYFLLSSFYFSSSFSFSPSHYRSLHYHYSLPSSSSFLSSSPLLHSHHPLPPSSSFLSYNISYLCIYLPNVSSLHQNFLGLAFYRVRHPTLPTKFFLRSHYQLCLEDQFPFP